MWQPGKRLPGCSASGDTSKGIVAMTAQVRGENKMGTDLILRVACSQTDPHRAQEAWQLLKTVPAYSTSLIQRIAISNGDSRRAESARKLMKTMPENSIMPECPLPLIHRIAARSRSADT